MTEMVDFLLCSVFCALVLVMSLLFVIFAGLVAKVLVLITSPLGKVWWCCHFYYNLSKNEDATKALPRWIGVVMGYKRKG